MNYVEQFKNLKDPAMDDETDKYLQNAHHAIRRTLEINVEYDITEDGDFINLRIPERKRK